MVGDGPARYPWSRMRRALLTATPALVLAGCSELASEPSPVAEAPLRVCESPSIRRA
jgi:hypothetical protein